MIEENPKSKLFGLLIVSALLTIIGLIFVYSSSSVYALEHCKDSAYYFKKQLLSVIIGIFLFIFSARLPLKKVQDHSLLLVLGSLLLTLIGFIPRFSINNACCHSNILTPEKSNFRNVDICYLSISEICSK